MHVLSCERIGRWDRSLSISEISTKWR
jgi:hypothetical protein